VDHFTISSTSVMHLGVANDLSTIPSSSPPYIKVQKPTEFTDNVNFQQLRTNYIQALDDDSDILIRGPTTETMKTFIDQVAFKTIP
jgi:hypothetical protein